MSLKYCLLFALVSGSGAWSSLGVGEYCVMVLVLGLGGCVWMESSGLGLVVCVCVCVVEEPF